jgi:hypothetical protein
MYSLKFSFVRCVLLGESLTNNIGPLCENNLLETLAHQAEQCWTIFLLGFKQLGKDLWHEVRKCECEQILGSKLRLVRHNVSCDIICVFFKGDLDLIRLFQPFLINLSGMPLVPREVQ